MGGLARWAARKLKEQAKADAKASQHFPKQFNRKARKGILRDWVRAKARGEA